MVPPQLSLETRGPVALVTLDDGKVNALTPRNLTALAEALDQLEADASVRAVVLAGRPGCYSAGLDLRVFPALPGPELAEAVRLVGRVLLRVFAFPRPTVAAVTGHALAGGALLALACDARVCAEGSFRFGVTEVAVGLPLPRFGVEIVRHSVPASQFAEVALHGATLGPDEVRARGLGTLAPAGSVLELALARATELARLDPRAYGPTKRAFRDEAARAALGALESELPPFSALLRTLSSP